MEKTLYFLVTDKPSGGASIGVTANKLQLMRGGINISSYVQKGILYQTPSDVSCDKIYYNLIINIILFLLNLLINFHPAKTKIRYNKYNSCFILLFLLPLNPRNTRRGESGEYV